MTASVAGYMGIIEGPAAGGKFLPPFSFGPTTSITSGQSPYTVPGGVYSVRNTGSPNAPVTINLPSAALGTCVDGQWFEFHNFDTAQQTITLVPGSLAAGDNIEAGTAHYISQYGAYCLLRARVAPGGIGQPPSTNWLFYSINTRDTVVFPQSVALVASMTNVAFGAVLIPGGVKAIRSGWLTMNNNLTAGSITVTIQGDIAATHTFTISSVGFRGTGQLLSPGASNWLTVPGLAAASTPAGSLITATVSTTAAFAAGASPVAGLLLDTY